ncbi:MAG: hypothetical protein K6F37_07205 [Lachnospiraceae bacterium]|nr:hypothetical protein [Lachnospiraceae bacterium]
MASTSETSFATLTNGYTKSFTFQKNWMDGNNKYGFRPDAIKVHLQYRVVGSGDDGWENALHCYIGSTEYSYTDSSDDTTALVITAETTAGNQSVVFKKLPTYIYDSTNGYQAIEYRVYEDAIGYLVSGTTDQYNWSVYRKEGTGEDAYIRAGSYVRETLTETDGNKTVLNNSLISNSLSITLNWENDSDNKYQTRPESVRFNLQYVKVNDDASVNYDQTTGFAWENVVDANGNDVIITLTSSDESDSDTWKKTVKSLAASDETNSFSLFYRAVEITEDSHPKTFVSGVEKTYKNYDETTNYSGSEAGGTLSKSTALDGTSEGACQGEWEYVSSSGVNYETVTNRLTTNAAGTSVTATKKWYKDETSSAVFELKYKTDSETTYHSFATPITETLYSTGTIGEEQTVSWDNLPTYDTDGNALTYIIAEKAPSTDAYYRVEEETTGIANEFSFVNIGTLDFSVTKTWENNYYGFPATINGYTGFTAEVALLKTYDGVNWEIATDTAGNNLVTNLTDQTATVYNTDGSVKTKGTDLYVFEGVDQYEKTASGDYAYVYYKAVETKINGVVTADGKEYLYPSAAAVTKAYTVDYVNDFSADVASKSHGSKTAITNTLIETEISLEKVWDDDSLANASDVHRPNAFSDLDFELYSSTDGSLVSDATTTAQLISDTKYEIDWDNATLNADSWTATVRGAKADTVNGGYFGLPRYAADGVTEITYSVNESTAVTASAAERSDLLRYTTAYESQTATVSAEATGEVALKVTNTLDLRLDIVKVDESDETIKIGGTTFVLYEAHYDEATDTYTSTSNIVKDVNGDDIEVTTDSNGKTSVEITKAGNYEIKETASATGYSDTDCFDAFFTVADSDMRKNVSLTSELLTATSGLTVREATTTSHLSENGITNTRKLGVLTIYKKDSDKTDKNIDGVTFTIYKKSSLNVFEKIWDFVTGNKYGYTESYATVEESTSGVTTIENLPWGSYKIVETATVDGYKVDSTPYYFVVNANTVEDSIKLYSDETMLTEKTNNAIYNYKTSVTFFKYNEDKTVALGGGIFEIRKYGETNAVEVYVDAAESEGKKTSLVIPTTGLTVYGLEAETLYVLHEVSAPTGYKLNKKDVTFYVSGAAKNYNIYTSALMLNRFDGNVVTMTDKAEGTVTTMYTAIANLTENESVTDDSNTSETHKAGGTVGVIRDTTDENDSIPEEYDRDDYVEGALGVYWNCDAEWIYENQFTIEYTLYETTSGETPETGTITVNGFIDTTNGEVITDTSASCYDELRAVYPNFDIYMNSKGSVVLHLATDRDDCPFKNEINVKFLPTIAVLNTTADYSGGMVMIDGGDYKSDADGYGTDGEYRYVNKTTVYAKAADGYAFDLDNIEMSEARVIEKMVKNRPASLTGKSENLVSMNGTNSFTTTLESEVAGTTSTYEINGTVVVTNTDEEGNPTEVEINLDSLPVPVDIGVSFKKMASKNGSSTGTDSNTSTDTNTDADNNNSDSSNDADNTSGNGNTKPTNTDTPSTENDNTGDNDDDKPGTSKGDNPGSSSDDTNSGVTPTVTDNTESTITGTNTVKTGDFDKSLPICIVLFGCALASFMILLSRRKDK